MRGYFVCGESLAIWFGASNELKLQSLQHMHGYYFVRCCVDHLFREICHGYLGGMVLKMPYMVRGSCSAGEVSGCLWGFLILGGNHEVVMVL